MALDSFLHRAYQANLNRARAESLRKTLAEKSNGSAKREIEQEISHCEVQAQMFDAAFGMGDKAATVENRQNVDIEAVG